MTRAYFRPDSCLVERLGESSGGDQSAMHSNALKEHKKNEGMIEVGLNHPLIFLMFFQCVGLRRRLVVRCASRPLVLNGVVARNEAPPMKHRCPVGKWLRTNPK